MNTAERRLEAIAAHQQQPRRRPNGDTIDRGSSELIVIDGLLIVAVVRHTTRTR